MVPQLSLVLLGVCAVCLSTFLEPRLPGAGGRSAGVLAALLGDGRRLFAYHFYVKADVYFHRGYYPSIFDNGVGKLATASAVTARPDEAEHDHDHNHSHGSAADLGDPLGDPLDGPASAASDSHLEAEKELDFLGKPKDWLERYGRHFYPSEHTHLEGKGEEREILPWLRLAAELDPNQVDVYPTASYWLRTKLGKFEEAEQFLREGLRANPGSPEILFELGRISAENRKDDDRARNIFDLALSRWERQEGAKKEPNLLLLEQIAMQLALLEKRNKNWSQALQYYDIVMKLTPVPEAVQAQIDEIKALQANDASQSSGSASKAETAGGTAGKQ